MVTKYLRAAMRGAKYELLEEGGYYGSIPGFDGVWADAACLEDCRDELEEVVQEWLLFRLSRQLPVPILDGIDLVVREVACCRQSDRSGAGISYSIFGEWDLKGLTPEADTSSCRRACKLSVFRTHTVETSAPAFWPGFFAIPALIERSGRSCRPF